MTPSELKIYFGKAGAQYYQFARGVDNRPVEAYRERKSRGVEHTFEQDITTDEEIDTAIAQLVADLLGRLSKSGFKGPSLTLKVKFSDFTQITRTLSNLPNELDPAILLKASHDLIAKADLSGRPIRLMGLTVSKATHSDERPGHPRQLVIDFDE